MAKRERPSWDETFMFAAYMAAARSSCIKLQTGSAIVNKDNRIIASSYNGAPPGIENCLEKGCRKEEYGIKFDQKGMGACRGAHAEPNAMSQIPRDVLKQPGIKLYTVYFPCTSCAKQITGNGIKEVIFSEYYNEPSSLTNELFQEAGINIRRLELDREKYFNVIRNIGNPKK